MPSSHIRLSNRACYVSAYGTLRTLEGLFHEHYQVAIENYDHRSDLNDHHSAYCYADIETAFAFLCSILRNFSSSMQCNCSYATVSLHLQLLKESFNQYIGIFEEDYHLDLLLGTLSVSDSVEIDAAKIEKIQKSSKEKIVTEFGSFEFYLSGLKMLYDLDAVKIARWKEGRAQSIKSRRRQEIGHKKAMNHGDRCSDSSSAD